MADLLDDAGILLFEPEAEALDFDGAAALFVVVDVEVGLGAST